MIIFECLLAAVSAPGVGFDSDSLWAPKKIDRERTDGDVYFGKRDPMATAKGEEICLKVAASAVRW